MHASPVPTTALLSLLALTLTCGCSDSTSSSNVRCDVTIRAIKPGTAEVGERVVLWGSPLTTPYDTAIYVGSTRATIADITRSSCAACDTCMDDEGCNLCGDCDACDLICQECHETVDFWIPEVDPGTWSVQLFNRHGESDAQSFRVLQAPATDTGGHDSGLTDTGPADTASPETGLDTATLTEDTADSGTTDSGTTDSGSPDTGGR